MGIWSRFKFWAGTRILASLDGGQHTRLFQGMRTSSASPDRLIQYDIASVRDRARHLVMNDSTIAGYVSTACDNVVGHCGVQLQAKIGNRNGVLNAKTNNEIERGWAEFSEAGNCTVDGRFSFAEVQRQVYAAKKVDGEVFIRVHVGPDWAHGLALQVIPADLLDETFDRAPNGGQNEVRMGVEVDDLGRPVAYHFYRRHPNDRFGSSRERVRVDAREVIHYRRPGLIGQTRAYSELAPVMFDALMLKGAQEAELVLWRQSASKGIRYVAKSEEAIQAYAAMVARTTTDAAILPETVELSPGLEQYIAPGWDAVPYDPSVPNTNVESFGRFILRRIARGLGVAYGTLTGDLSDANYSSMRAGLLPERDHWMTEQQEFVSQVLVPVYRRWIAAALLRNVVSLDNRLGSMYHEVEFRGRGWRSVDPLKDSQANQVEIQQGTLTRTEVAADSGRNFEDVVDQLAREQEYAKARGVNIDGDAVATAKANAMTNAENGAERPKSLRAIS